MRAYLFLAIIVSLSGCNNGTTTEKVTTAPARAEGPATEGPKGLAPTPHESPSGLNLPWSEGTANEKLMGLTDDQLTELIGKPDAVHQDPQYGDRRQWQYKAKKWLKPDPAWKDATEPTAMNVVLKNGKVIRVLRG